MDISIFYTENFMTQHKRSILSPVSNVSQHFLSLIDLVLMMVFSTWYCRNDKNYKYDLSAVCVCNNTVIQITSNQHKPKNASVGRGGIALLLKWLLAGWRFFAGWYDGARQLDSFLEVANFPVRRCCCCCGCEIYSSGVSKLSSLKIVYNWMNLEPKQGLHISTK